MLTPLASDNATKIYCQLLILKKKINCKYKRKIFKRILLSKFYFSSAEIVKLLNNKTATRLQTCDDIYDYGYRSSRIYEIFIGGKFRKVFCELEQKGNNWLVSVYVTAYSGLKKCSNLFWKFLFKEDSCA